MKKSIWQWILVIGLILNCQSAFAFGQLKSTDEFISLADIHFDPFANCKLSLTSCKLVDELRAADYKQWDSIFKKYDTGITAKAGADTNYTLFKVMVQELQRVRAQEHPQFGLILGDFLVHKFRQKFIRYGHDFSKDDYQQFVKKTLQYITQQIHQALPDIDIYPAVGNNDSYTGDYNDVPRGKFFQDTAVTWSLFIADKSNRQSLLKTFPTGGYYAVTVPGTRQRIILLNTVLFSTNAPTRNAAAADEELKWLHTQLKMAAAQKQFVILAFHIPVGVDVYKTLRKKLGLVSFFWQEKYSEAFSAELKAFANSVKFILPGHIHVDSFQFITVNQIENIPVIFTPSVSPIFGNDPAVKIFHYNVQTGALQNYATYFLPLERAKVTQED